MCSVGGDGGPVEPGWDRRELRLGSFPGSGLYLEGGQMFLTICRYESWSTIFPESFKDSSLGGGVGDNPLATCRFNLDSIAVPVFAVVEFDKYSIRMNTRRGALYTSTWI